MNKGLRKLRTSLAIISFSLISLLFFDFSGVLHHWLGWMAKVQLIPALLSINLGVLILLAALTFVFGRIYCSVLCPLGVMQDIISWFAGKRKRNRFSYSKPKNWLRYGLLVLFTASIFGGITFIVTLFDPYAAFGRIASNLFAPLYHWANNVLAYFSKRIDVYTFYSVDVWLKSIAVLLTAVITLFMVGSLAWKHGRTYCNTICPVGTFLGFISRYSLFKPVLDSAICNGCNACSRNCKAACIDVKSQTIDYSRCVSCFDCIDKCKQNAIQYKFTLGKHKINKQIKTQPVKMQESANNARRSFLTIAGVFALTNVLKSQNQIREGGLAVIED